MPTRKAKPSLKAMNVAGIMSGTSGDGIDVALVRISLGPSGTKLSLLAHHSVPYSSQLRAAVLDSMDAKSISTAELARLNCILASPIRRHSSRHSQNIR